MKARRTLFNDVVKDMNVSIFHPRKDKCDTCIGHDLGHVSDELWQNHVAMKNEARSEKEKDKEEAKFVFTMDVEAVLLCPRTKASSMYFKQKLMVHNFTLYDLKTKNVLCYLWDETEADLSINVFTTFLHAFTTKRIKFEPGNEIIFYSDGCTYQNRNVTVSNVFINIAVKYNITIVQKFLEKGHTQMECDAVHAAIEARLRYEEIYLPSGYINIARTARVENPYEVEYVHHDFFKNFDGEQNYASIRPGKVPGDPCVTDLRALKYSPDGLISYKLRHTEEWRNLPHRKVTSSTNKVVQSSLFPKRLPITDKNSMRYKI